ncbi:hypothetical protein MG293_000022 [Ovis ammon polii]|uniref:Uncharacterized protein n=1 Tax=Ovis ammon polii TaxID=230172 RepID=A0AAD4YHP2_OVIAM|nr:hypothetical protein MG293_000022 [Ovis ammon polii]
MILLQAQSGLQLLKDDGIGECSDGFSNTLPQRALPVLESWLRQFMEECMSARNKMGLCATHGNIPAIIPFRCHDSNSSASLSCSLRLFFYEEESGDDEDQGGQSDAEDGVDSDFDTD